MQIRYTIEDLAFDAKTIDGLEAAVRKFLSDKSIGATVSRDGGFVVVEYPDSKDIDAEEDERIVLGFCRDRHFGKARKVVEELLTKSPCNSEAYRLYAQIEMECESFDKAIDLAKDALRLNPSNLYALILLGNLYARDKDSPEQGLPYFRRAYELYPESVLAITNYACTIGQTKTPDKDEQERLYRRAIEIDPTYLNPYYALTQWYMDREDYAGLFAFVQDGLKKAVDRPENPAPLKQLMTEILVKSARVVAERSGKEVLDALRQSVEDAGGVKVRIEEREGLGVPAKMELAERYHRESHNLVYDPSAAKGTGLQLYSLVHELEKLLMSIEAKKTGRDACFACSGANREKFHAKTLDYVTDKFRAMIPKGALNDIIENMYIGAGGQMMNCPLDFFVTKRLYDKYPEFRAVQVAAATGLASASLSSVMTGVQGSFPKNIVRINRTLCVVTFMQYRDLLGLDLVSHLEASADETKLAKELYDVCVKAEASYRPGDEWDVVRTFISKMQCDDYFRVVSKDDDRKEEEEHKEKTRIFQENFKSGEDPALNMAVTMHMVDALKRLKKMEVEQVRRVAAEIAILGTHGISPAKKSGYAVPSLGNEDMSGPRMLAYYYVSWKIGFPEKVDALGLPFEKEYEQAVSISGLGG